MNKILGFWTIISIGIFSLSVNAAEISCDDTSLTCSRLGYTYSAKALETLDSTYDCTACPLDGTKWACVRKVVEPPKPSCPTGSSTAYAPMCEKVYYHSEEVWDGYSFVWKFYNPGKACDNVTFRTQFSAGTASQCYTKWGSEDTKTSFQYRCKMGELEGADCLSSSTYMYYVNKDGTTTPEPCNYLFGAEPDPSCEI